MAESQVNEHFTSDSQEAALAQYRPYSALAVVGLLLGLASALAFWHPVMWWLPVVAALVNGLALWRISRQGPELAGRGAALAGLCLAVVLGIAAPTRHLSATAVRRAAAGKVAMQWFAHLADDQPQMAAQLQLDPLQRKGPDEDVWAYYRDDPKARETLEQLVAGPVARNLLALADKAQVRYYQTEADVNTSFRQTMVQIYAVTFERDGEPTTFFVRVVLQRNLRSAIGAGGWSIVRANLVTEPLPGWNEVH